MINRKWFAILALAALVIATAYSQLVPAESPALTLLKTHIASLQEVLCDPKLNGSDHLRQRRKLERVILEQLFDFHEMARRALGTNARQHADRLGEFTPLFVDFLEHAYMGTLEENGDAKIRYLREIADHAAAEVHTTTSLRDGSDYRVDYKLFLGPSGWRAYDVIIEGISLVENYHAQFDRVLQKKSFNELLQDLRQKRDKFD